MSFLASEYDVRFDFCYVYVEKFVGREYTHFNNFYVSNGISL